MSVTLSSISLFTLYSAKYHRTSSLGFSPQYIQQLIQVSSSSSRSAQSSFVNLPKGLNFGRGRWNLASVASTPAEIIRTTGSKFRNKNPKDVNILVMGATGYIGKFVVKELVNRGFNVIAIAREKSGIRGRNDEEETLSQLQGANVCFSDVTHMGVLDKSLENLGVSIDVVLSCLAIRTGGVKDSWKIDYEATKNSLVAGRKHGASHFVLLSAICVQKPLLEFQRAKLKFEAELMKEAVKSCASQRIVLNQNLSASVNNNENSKESTPDIHSSVFETYIHG